MLSAPEEVRKLLDVMLASPANSPTAQRASDQIEVLCRGYMATPSESRWDKYHFTKTEGRIVNAIFAAPAKTITRSSLMDAVYFDKQDEPEHKVLDVLMVRIRQKLAQSPYSIETVHGTGFRGTISQ